MDESIHEEKEDESDKSAVESSSDDEHQWKKAVKEEYKKVQREKKIKERKERMQNKSNNNQIKEPKFYEIKEGASLYSNSKNTNDIIKNEKLKKLPLANRLQQSKDSNRNAENTLVFRNDSFGNKQMTFLSRKAQRDKESERKATEHHNERKSIRRSAGKITKTFKKPNLNYSKKK